jgi:hypothetical protein
MDGLNFCFWPDDEFEYEHLAGGLKVTMQRRLSLAHHDCMQHAPHHHT